MRHRMRRRAKPTLCPRCRALVLSGLDADVAALHVRVEVERLSPWGEAMARHDGRRTFEVTRDCRLFGRDDDLQITSQSALRVWVHAEHKCGTRLPPEWISPVRPTRKATPDDCPF